MASNTQFIVEFKADLKEIKAAYAELERMSKKFTKQKTETTNKEKKERKEEKKHVEDISKKKLLTAKELYKQERLQFLQDKLKYQQAALYNKQVTQHAKMMASMGLAPNGQPLPSKNKGVFSGAALGTFAGSLLGQAAGGLINMLLSGISAGYQRRVGLVESRNQLIGLAPNFHQIMGSIYGETGIGLGFNRQDVQNMVLPMARATGVTNPRQLMAGMRAGGALSAEETAQIFNMIRQGGSSFQPDLDVRGNKVVVGNDSSQRSRGGEVFKKWIAAGIEAGMEQARLPEFFSSIQNLMQEQSRVQSGQVTGNEIASLLGVLGKSGVPGFQNARGGQFANSLNQMFMSPGGGETGRAFLMQSQGFGLPGGRTSWYQAAKNIQSGITGEQGLKNLEQLLNQMKSMGFTGESGAVLLNTLSNGKISYDMAEQFQKIVGSGGDLKSKLEQMNTVMKGGASLEDKAQEAMVGLEGDFKQFLKMFNDSLQIGQKIEPMINGMQELLQEITKAVVGYLPYIKDIKALIWDAVDPTHLVRKAYNMFAHSGDNTYEDVANAKVNEIMKNGFVPDYGGISAPLNMLNNLRQDTPTNNSSEVINKIAKAINSNSTNVSQGITGAIKMTVNVVTQDGTQNVQSPGVIKIF